MGRVAIFHEYFQWQLSLRQLVLGRAVQAILVAPWSHFPIEEVRLCKFLFMDHKISSYTWTKADCMVSLLLFGYIKLWASLCYLANSISAKERLAGAVCLVDHRESEDSTQLFAYPSPRIMRYLGRFPCWGEFTWLDPKSIARTSTMSRLQNKTKCSPFNWSLEKE